MMNAAYQSVLYRTSEPGILIPSLSVCPPPVPASVLSLKIIYFFFALFPVVQ